MDIENSYHSYDADENYIIFRDIDLSSANWTPLMFSGTMVGAKANNPADQSTLWVNAVEDDYSAATGFAQGVLHPEIRNVTVVQNMGVEVEKTKGVGFFATLSSEMDVQTLRSNSLVSVRNLVWRNVHIENNTKDIIVSESLINSVLGIVGGAVGIILDGLLRLVGIQANLHNVLTTLLEAHKNDRTALATGAFAGRIEGNVEVTDCLVTGDVLVTNINSMMGGFVGYTNGYTQYATEGIGNLISLLEKLLNLIPGLGVGDIITILLGNALPLDQLLPIGYERPRLTGCVVAGLSGSVGSDSTDFNGGFAGQIIGTQLTDCHVKDSSYTVQAESYGGGFVGLARDAEIKGMLQEGLGILTTGATGSLILQCSVENWVPAMEEGRKTVQGGSYLGGFAGALANSYTVDCSVSMKDSAALSVYGTGSHVGGWAGVGAVGWVMDLGKDNTNDTTLLGGVTGLLTGLLNNEGDTTALLSVAGLSPSAIMGCQINSAGLTVHADGDYVGGFVGDGNGLYLTSSSAAYLKELTYWKYDVITKLPSGGTGRANGIDGLTSVEAGGSCAGGAAGSLGGASVGGLLNDTVGLGKFLGFTVDGMALAGPYSVSAKEYAGGALGLAMGGTVKNVNITNLTSVSAENMAGGFIGAGGPGSLAATDGLSLNLLGLNNLLEVGNLLNVIPGVKLELDNCTVSSAGDGYTVEATGSDDPTVEYVAGGFIARSNSTNMTNCHAENLKSVTADNAQGYAGGFVGMSRTGDLAELGDLKNSEGTLIAVNDLLGTIDTMVPDYTNCTVTYLGGGYVQANVAGGFAGDFQSGKVDNRSRKERDYYAVYNIDHVNGQTYAGGFGGKVYSGALADAGGGISILGKSGLSIDLSQLLDVIEAYVPYIQYAGVKSDNGFTVTALMTDGFPMGENYGSAGGFIGYASGAQISYCDVTSLKHTTVTPPNDLEAMEAPSYFNENEKTESTYAVTGERYAGGFVGCMDIGSAASVGDGLKVLGTSIQLTEVLSALDMVVTTIEHSNVTGAAGGYSVLASNGVSKSSDSGSSGVVGRSPEGHAGGFAGIINGGHIQNSNAHNFEYVIGQISAGGYVGEMKPGDVTKFMEDVSVLGNLVDVDKSLASLLQTFVPTIRNSSTDAVPCGGVVRAQAGSDSMIQRGMAGGYVGHNMGGSIWGLNNDPWKTADDSYTGSTSLCKAERIRSVYGAEYAGGYTGFMEAADTANVGGLSILNGLITANNVLGALSVVYPTQENTAVYGPLANLDVNTWNKWVEYVGKYGGYGYELAQTGKVNIQNELDAKLAQYIYGFNVVAGRDSEGTNLPNPGGDAGGYVGLMQSGTLTNCMAYDVKQVKARGAAGGYAGRMETGGAAEFGSVSILGLNLNVGQLVDLAQFFVPAVRNSSVQGFTSGMTITATGTPAAGDDVGYAGGFVGAAYGAQIQINDNDLPNTEEPGSVAWASSDKYPAPTASCDVRNLRRVTGRNAIGGYVGVASSSSLASVNTNASSGILQGILNSLIDKAGDLVDLLPATYTTIHKASVSPADSQWGFVVDGTYQEGSTTRYAPYAGGFAGFVQAASIGEKADAGTTEEQQTTYRVTVNGLRSVQGGLYAGGFFGMADVAGVAEVGGTGSDGGTTDVIGPLIQLGRIDAMDVLRCYINNAAVHGVAEGFAIQAYSTNAGEGIYEETRQTGCAGGFGGGLMNGTVQNGAVTSLSSVQALNYTGGFIGHMGKSGVVDVDSVELLNKFLALGAGVSDLFGSQVFDSIVAGIPEGATIQAMGGKEPIAGGFVGYSDLGRIKNDHVTDLKKVTSDQIAGGFIGKTDMAYLVSVGADSPLLNGVLYVVNELVKALYQDSDRLQSINLAHFNLGIVSVDVLREGNVAKVNLLGIQISVALSKQSDNPNQQTDVAIITIGDSAIRLPCTEDGVNEDDLKNVEINLIKGNRTELDNCSVTGVANGYDVFAGGATQETDGTHANGMAGGFVGYNHEGKISNSEMVLCDTVRGRAQKVGPFTGYNDLKSVYWFNTIASIEGEGNTYSIYRPLEAALTNINTNGGNPIGAAAVKYPQEAPVYNRYVIQHINSFEDVLDTGKELSVYDMFKALEGADEVGENDEGETTATRELNAYISDAQAVLMRNAASPDNPPTLVPEPGVNADPCYENVDLTIHKVWDDWFNFGQTRPDSITLTICRQEYDADGTPIGATETYKSVTLTSADQDGPWSAVWSTVLKNVPLYKYEDANGNGVLDYEETITAYYVYTVKEENVPAGYTVSYEFYDPNHVGDYELTVTNKLNIPLPDTGGAGDSLFVVVGVGILLLGVALGKRRTRRRGAQ
ncbi:LPXTG cell wall anchor domain-containing protein [Allofournierella massiliensis]|uniref:LPXTG cell wall anchor domain-containing protein n=1 Tax=Allofournierella massiliensis TaxID=1650663 RepID=UPI0024B19DDF|nr:LPXTG cell wall anchor domain-containing protein [Fournierella massiliensis]